VAGGVIAYSNDVKQALLDVPAELLARHGAVSEAVALAMAAGARKHVGAEIGVGITGVAGPGGGTADKPVGTVWVAVDAGDDARAVRSALVGDREEIRYRATQSALDIIRRMLTTGVGGRAAEAPTLAPNGR
jgi:nicotinamide-nucleotide amidase